MQFLNIEPSLVLCPLRMSNVQGRSLVREQRIDKLELANIKRIFKVPLLDVSFSLQEYFS